MPSPARMNLGCLGARGPLAPLACLAHRDELLVRIDHEDGVGDGAHALQTAEVLLEALALLLELDDLFLHELLVSAVLLHALEGAEAVEALLDRAEVGQGAA